MGGRCKNLRTHTGPSETRNPEGVQYRNGGRKAWDVCPLLPRSWRKKQVVISDSRWTRFQGDLYKCLLERGIQSHLGSGFTVLLYCWEQERQEKFLLFSHRRISVCELAVIGVLEMGKKFYQSSSELRVTEKPNPAGLEKGVCEQPYRKVHGRGEGRKVWLRDSCIQGHSHGYGSFRFSILLSMIASFLNATYWYNGCLYLQANIFPDSCLLVK